MPRHSKTSVKQPSSEDSFYYCNGQQVELTRASNLLAIDLIKAKSLPSIKKILSRLVKTAKPLMHGLSLVNVRELSGDQIASSLNSGVAQPVYEAEGTTIVVLPEVRVEESRGEAERASIRNWLMMHSDDFEFSESDDQFTIRLTKTKRGDAALALANEIVEQVNPEVAQARFVRITKRP